MMDPRLRRRSVLSAFAGGGMVLVAGCSGGGPAETPTADAGPQTDADVTDLGGGGISGLTLDPGHYKWGTGVDVRTGASVSGRLYAQTDVTLEQATVTG